MSHEAGGMVTVIGVSQFLPRHLWRHAARYAAVPIRHIAIDLQGTALMADISGFSVLTDRLAREGSTGLARLSAELNRVLGAMADIIRNHGGDLDATSGDAVLALWQAGEGGCVPRDCAAAALACARALLAALDKSGTEDGITLRLRVAIVSGDMRVMHLGGADAQWMHVLSGPPLFRLSDLLDRTAPGDIAADQATGALLDHRVETRPMVGTGVLVTGGGGLLALPVLQQDPVLSASEETGLDPFLPPAIRVRRALGPGAWAAEIRTITVMFLSLTGIEPASAGDITAIQRVVAEIQTILMRYDAHIHALSVHDKGPMVMVVFGLPGEAHADDAFRAVRATRDVQTMVDRLWLDSTCGIATGRAYCGPIGSRIRLAYSVIGDVVNRASRLQSGGRYRIQCDQATVAAIGRRMRFERMPDVKLKGMADPVSLFCPRIEVEDRVEVGALAPAGPTTAVRTGDLKTLIACVTDAPGAQDCGLRVVVLGGEAGMGKSSLLHLLSDHATAQGWSVLQGRTDPFSREVPFLGWRRVFARLLDLDPLGDPVEAMARISASLDAVPALAERAALFNPVLPVALADTPVTLAMRGPARLDSTVEAMAEFLCHAQGMRPTLIVLDDVQWLDTASRALVRRLVDMGAARRAGPHMALVLAGRPGPGMDEVCDAVRTVPAAVPLSEMTLAPLGPEETGSLVAATLQAARVDPDLVAFMQEKTGGTPFFVRELVLALLAAGAIAHDGDRVRAPNGVAALAARGFPESVERTVLARFDRLSAAQQTILKCAAVIGTAFRLNLLVDLAKDEVPSGTLASGLAALVRDQLLDRLPAASGQEEYAFNHMIAQDLIYSLLLPADAGRRHHRIADWLSGLGEGTDPAVVAGHYFRAGAFGKAAAEYERSGTDLLRVGTDRDSIRQLERAMDSIHRAGLTGQDLRLARLRRHLGEACNRLGLLREAQDHLEAGLVLLGRPWPASKGRVTRAGVAAFLVQIGRARLGSRLSLGRAATQATVERAAERAATYSHLGHTLYFANRDLEIILAVVEQANHAEIAADSQLLADGYLQISNVMGIFGLHSIAERYQARFAVLRPVLGPVALARCNQLQSLYLASVGRFAACRDLLHEALGIAESLGDQRYRREFLSLLGVVTLPLGEIALSQASREGFLRLARASSDQQALLWGLIEAAEIALHLGDHATVEARVAEATPLLPQFGAGELIWAQGILARGFCEAGQMERALDLAGQTLARIRKTMPVSYYTIEGYCGVAEVFLCALEDGRGDSQRRTLRRETAAAIKAVKRFATSFPIARPRLLTLQSRLADCDGRREAPRLAARALAEAERLGMPVEALHARTLLTRHQSLPDVARLLPEIDRAYAAVACAPGRARLRRIAEGRGITLPPDLPREDEVAFAEDLYRIT